MLRAFVWGCCALVVAIGLLTAGCAQSESEHYATSEVGASAALPMSSPATPSPAISGDASAPQRFAVGDEGKIAAVSPALLNRKIIYNANIDLVVEDFTGVADRVAALVKQCGGYIADSTLTGDAGVSRRGLWKIRVPVEKFDSFIGSAKGLGEVTRAATTSQDVSEEYYDVEARIRNKSKEEERLIKLLEDRPGKLEDVIAIERELSRVREEVERLEGRQRLLADLTSLTTITLTVNEIRGYQPPESPTLATRISRSFSGSVESMQVLGEGLLIGAAGFVPWLPIVAVMVALGYWLARRSWRWARLTLEPRSHAGSGGH